MAYVPRDLNKSQKRKKKTIYLECFGFTEAVEYWQYRLLGKSYTVYSDHKPLKNMNIESRTDEELWNSTYYLSQYNLEIEYAPGKDNLEADCLRRNPVLEPDDIEEKQLKIVNCWQRVQATALNLV